MVGVVECDGFAFHTCMVQLTSEALKHGTAVLSSHLHPRELRAMVKTAEAMQDPMLAASMPPPPDRVQVCAQCKAVASVLRVFAPLVLTSRCLADVARIG